MEKLKQNEVGEIETIIQSISYMLKRPIDKNSYEVIDRGVPHIPQKLPDGKMAIYMFKYNGDYLKIGKVGYKSNARFLSQHYLPNSSRSNLSKSILKDCKSYEQLDFEHIGEWIKNNCQRIDIIIDKNLGPFTLGLIEAILQYRFKPKYEGKES